MWEGNLSRMKNSANVNENHLILERGFQFGLPNTALKDMGPTMRCVPVNGSVRTVTRAGLNSKSPTSAHPLVKCDLPEARLAISQHQFGSAVATPPQWYPSHLIRCWFASVSSSFAANSITLSPLDNVHDAGTRKERAAACYDARAADSLFWFFPIACPMVGCCCGEMRTTAMHGCSLVKLGWVIVR